MRNPNFQLPTFAEATEKGRVSKATAALDALITHYDLDNMSERELRTLHGQLGDIQTQLDEYANDVLHAAEECEPERHECTFCDTFHTRVDYDYDEVMVWCKKNNHWTHIEPVWVPKSDSGDAIAERGTNFLDR